jgi:hypothetical protein
MNNQNKLNNRKQSKRNKEVDRIQSVAFNSRISRSLTFQQAFSILLRSQELKAEQEGITAEQKAFEIDESWRQRRAQLNSSLPRR